MLIKLVQGETLDVSSQASRLDYSGLRGDSDWEVWVSFPDCAERKIAHVTWSYAAGYTLNLAIPHTGPFDAYPIPCRQDIVPAVKAEITIACREGAIRDPEGPLLIRVFPNAAT